MSSKTKIVVLHSKEVIYTAIFAVLGILLVLLLFFMFSPKKTVEKKSIEERVTTETGSRYIPGVYSSSIVLNNSVIDIEIAVDDNNINSIAIVNLDEAVSVMYPLIKPSFEEITAQIYKNQSLEGISYSDDNKYTSLVLIEAINEALNKAVISEESIDSITGEAQIFE
ncbi:MAG: hypothetical protein QM697_00270 [Lachnospiraceae bacterium]